MLHLPIGERCPQAEAVGLEPTRELPQAVFKTGAARPKLGLYLHKEFWTGFHRQLHRCPVASHLGYRIPEAIVGIEPTQDCFAGSCLHTASSMAIRSPVSNERYSS